MKRILFLFIVIAGLMYAQENYHEHFSFFAKKAGTSQPQLEPETILYVNRVEADGGTIIDTNSVDSFVVHAKTNGYWDSLYIAYNASWGVKKDVTNYASKLYDIKGVNDLVQTTASAQPRWHADTLNSKPALVYDGTNDYLILQKLIIASNPYTSISIGRRTGISGFLAIGSDTSLAHYISPFNISGDNNIYIVGSSGFFNAGSFDNYQPHINITNYDGNRFSVWRGSNPFTLQNWSPGTRGYTFNNSGRYGSANVYASQILSSILHFNRQLSDTKRIAVYNYLNAKYGVY